VTAVAPSGVKPDAAIAAGAAFALRLMADCTVARTGGSLSGFAPGAAVPAGGLIDDPAPSKSTPSPDSGVGWLGLAHPEDRALRAEGQAFAVGDEEDVMTADPQPGSRRR
jgi:hypothetical protein